MKIKKSLVIIGWREWVSFPDWKVGKVKAKIDTGARTSSLHVSHLKEINKDREPWISFSVYPNQKDRTVKVDVEAPLLEWRKVKSSSGHTEARPVVLASIFLAGKKYKIELTLANRDQMGFRMLLGREAMRGRFLVNCGKSYLGNEEILYSPQLKEITE